MTAFLADALHDEFQPTGFENADAAQLQWREKAERLLLELMLQEPDVWRFTMDRFSY